MEHRSTKASTSWPWSAPGKQWIRPIEESCLNAGMPAGPVHSISGVPGIRHVPPGATRLLAPGYTTLPVQLRLGVTVMADAASPEKWCWGSGFGFWCRTADLAALFGIRASISWPP